METKRGTELGIKDTHKYLKVPCLDCGKERWVTLRNGEPLSKRCHGCAGKAMKRFGAKAPCWKGGRIRDKISGYIRIKLTPDDFFFPMADKLRYVSEHRLVVAKALGRCLLPWETVHHKEGYAKDDNRYPETLELLPNQYKHDALTHMISHIRRLEKRVANLQIELGEVKCRH